MSIRKTPAGNWEVTVYNRATDKRTYRTFASKRDAQAFETTMKAKLQHGSIHDPNEGRMTFGTYARHYIDSRELAVNTRRSYEAALRRLAPLWGNRRLDSLRYSDAVALEAAIGAEHAGNGARNSLVFARTVMNSAMLDRIIERSPFVGVKLRKARDVRPVELPTWQVVRAVVEGRTGKRTPVRMTKRQTLIAVMAGSGLRGAEVLGLTTDSVDFLRREITVKRTLNHINDVEAAKAGYARSGFYVKGAKSEAGQDRVVPVPQWMLDVLGAWLAENPPVEVSVAVDRPDADAQVMLAPLFGLITGTNLTSLVRASHWPDGSKYSPHDLRKVFATELEQSGLPMTTLRTILGHQGVGVTSLYVHVKPETYDQAREILTAAWTAAGAGEPTQDDLPAPDQQVGT